MVFQVLRAFLSPSFAKFTSSKSAICMLLQSKMISKIQLIGNKEVTLFVKLNR